MKRCMFVDDSSVIRKVAKRILGGPDMMVIEADSAEQALDMCSIDMPEVIVVDTGLPDMPAEDFIRRVRAIPAAVKPQIVISMIELESRIVPSRITTATKIASSPQKPSPESTISVRSSSVTPDTASMREYRLAEMMRKQIAAVMCAVST